MVRLATALLVIGVASAPIHAQSATPAQAAAQPQSVVKKRVCTVEQADEIGSRIATRKVCRMVEEKAPQTVSSEQRPGTAAKPNAE